MKFTKRTQRSRRTRNHRTASSQGRKPRFELLEARRLLASYTVSTAVDESDGDFAPGDLSLREAIERANLLEGADTIDFDASLAGQPIVLSVEEFDMDGPIGLAPLVITESVTITGLGADDTLIDAH